MVDDLGISVGERDEVLSAKIIYFFLEDLIVSNRFGGGCHCGGVKESLWVNVSPLGVVVRCRRLVYTISSCVSIVFF